ncbi:MAG: acetyl-CoA carboxylase carboxyltransferase subunit alpha [Vulcanimicrobiaceae bacterium]
MNLIVERERGPLAQLEARIAELRARDAPGARAEIAELEAKYRTLLLDVFGELSPWERVHMARHPKRPLGGDYLAALDAFDELHGDRRFRDDPALVGGFAKVQGRRIVALAQLKGRDTKENVKRNFGMVSPEGYRKAARLMALADRFGLPIVSFVDTAGADPGIGSEERGQSEAIASCLATLAGVRVPIVAAIVGEGGSGGALALALSDYTLMAQHAVYSVASPEGCAAILWGDASRAPEAAEHLRLTSGDLVGFEIVDEVVPEPLGGAHRDASGFMAAVLSAIGGALAELVRIDPETLRERRYERYRRIGAHACAENERLLAAQR